jgi:hypothetical protein
MAARNAFIESLLAKDVEEHAHSKPAANECMGSEKEHVAPEGDIAVPPRPVVRSNRSKNLAHTDFV